MNKIGTVQPLEYARGMGGDEGFKWNYQTVALAAGVQYPFNYNVRDDLGLDMVASIWIDNADNAGNLTMVMTATGWRFRCSAKTQGFYPLIATPGTIAGYLLSQQAAIIGLGFLNKEALSLQWPAS